MKVEVRGILFDMDGVLVSSLASVERCWRQWAREYGVDPELAVQTAHGCRAVDTVRFLRPDIDAQAGLKRIEDLEVEDDSGLTVLPGVKALIEKLPPQCWTVVTSATRRLAKVRLEQGGLEVPEHFITADMVAEGKPHPEPYLAGAATLGLRPEDCLVIEDSVAGTHSGHDAGCKVLATLFSYPLEQLTAADWIVNALDQVTLTVSEDVKGPLLTLSFEPLPRS